MRRWRAFLLLAALVGCDDTESADSYLSAEALMDPQNCAECHAEHVQQWQGSMHAYAGDDPVFLAMNARGQRETDGALGDFCVSCHAPLSVALGLTTDGLNLSELAPKDRGITCAFCHQVSAVEGDHNNPLKLTLDGVMRAGLKSPLENPAHASAYSPLHDRDELQSASMCGSCHDITLPNGVALERTFAEWRDTVFNSEDPLQKASCNTCHMPGRNAPAADFEGVTVRRIHDHSMPGVDVALTDWPEKAAQRSLVQRELDSTLVAEMCVILRPGGARVEAYLENIGAGHSLPSGASQDRRLWVELQAHVDDEVVYESGVVGDTEAVGYNPDDTDLWLLRDHLFGASGDVVHMFWQTERIESNVLPAPSTRRPGEAGYIDPHVPHTYTILTDTEPTRISMRARLRPMGFDVLEDLVDSGDLDPKILDQMPTFTLGATAIEWTREAASLRISPASGLEALCVP